MPLWLPLLFVAAKIVSKRFLNDQELDKKWVPLCGVPPPPCMRGEW
jgi:hypothetical protein